MHALSTGMTAVAYARSRRLSITTVEKHLRRANSVSRYGETRIAGLRFWAVLLALTGENPPRPPYLNLTAVPLCNDAAQPPDGAEPA